MNAERRLSGLKEYLRANKHLIGKIVDFNPEKDKFLAFDFTSNNKTLTADTIADTGTFSKWIEDKLRQQNAKFGLGGYNELRTLYNQRALFNEGEEPRQLHLGVDIWAPAHTCIYSPLEGKVHSFKNNEGTGNYGATIILEHNLKDITLFSLFGHLSLKSLAGLIKGKIISTGTAFAELGNANENGNWPPHLHYQLIFDLNDTEGDYPGVCRLSEKNKYLQNCPDPNLILQHTFG
ncbi:peptidoglycan DD-metalloendopeptidase family protein [Rubrolithibacter danxiaensis]|uniref:peptidoglycan DD-metalloendopeptidase family protein n=1 Tax=Rubrolithibacter danxiaensis TaxID=3390805 RepID=UPI003BF82897